MIQIGSIHILTAREFSKYEKLYKIFRTYSHDELDGILSGKVHLRRNPVRTRKAAYPYRPANWTAPSPNDGTL